MVPAKLGLFVTCGNPHPCSSFLLCCEGMRCRLLCTGCVETAYLFPGIGLGCIVSRANRLRDDAFIAAAEALAKLVTNGEPPLGKQKLHWNATCAVIGAMHYHTSSQWRLRWASF